jgi:hypothetical protein
MIAGRMEEAASDGGRVRGREGLLVLAGYAFLAVLTTWPLAGNMRTHVVAHGPREATAALNIWSMAWVVHQLPRSPLHLFDANSFHPYPHTLAYSEHLLVPALAAAPVGAATGNWVLAYNAVTLATLSLAGFGMYVLAWALARDRLAALAAGALYAFHTWNVNELVRLQILSNAWFPLLLAALLRYFRAPRARTAWAAALFYGLQSLSCMYWALYAPLLLLLALAVLQWTHRLPGRDLLRLVARLAVPAAAVVVTLVPYLQVARDLGFERSTPASLPVERYLAVHPGNLLYGSLLEAGGPNQNAGHFPGLAAALLALIGLWRGRAQGHGREVQVLLGLLMVGGLLLSLGPRIEAGGVSWMPGPYALVREWVPGFRNVRYPERLALFVMLGLAPAAALGLAWVRRRLGQAVAAALALLVWVEHLAVPLYLDPLPGGRDVPQVYRRLAGRPETKVVAEVPAARHRLERFDALPMYFSTAHWKRTVEGFSGYFPPTYNFTKWRLFHFPAPESVSFLERLGVDTLVVRPEGMANLSGAPGDRWTVEGPFDGGHHVLRLVGASASPRFPLPPEPTAGLAEIPRDAWRVQASSPDAGRAVDGDLQTAWTSPLQEKGQFYRVGLAEPALVSRISLSVVEPYEFPMRLRVMLQDPDGSWAETDIDEGAAYGNLFARLLHDPRRARLDLDIPPRRLSGFRLRIPETDPFWMPWSLAEIRAYGPR